ncbi:unnamed protein product [Schistosoma guineensis]|nr:unnamed protein product [Schistosoma guineensis]
MRQTRDLLELKAFIQRCRRADLDKLIKLTNLPRGGLKQDIQLRLISYLDQDPSTEFLSALHELRGLMYSPVNLQFQQSNGNFDPHCPSNDLPSSFVYLRDPTIRCSTESSKNSSGPNPCVTGTKTSCVLQKEQLRHNPYVVQPNTSVFEQSSPDELNSTRSRQQKSQQTVSSNELTQSSLFPGNPVINPSVWSSWESVNKLLPENRVTTSQSHTSGKSQNFNPHSQTNVALPIPILSNSAMSDGHSEIHVHSECPQSSIHTLSTDSRKAAVTHKIGPLITLAGVDGSFRLPAVLPEFNFKESPFFKLIDVLLPPQIILPAHIGFATGRRSYDRSLALRFTSDQVETITYHCWRGSDERMEFGVQVIMRFARLDPQACQHLVQTYELYGSRKSSSLSLDKLIQIPLAEDSLPVHLIIQVNGRPIQLPPLLPSNRPGMDGRRNPRPINITQSLHVSPTVPNYIKLTWTHDYSSYTYNVVGIYLMRRRSPQQLCGLLHSTSFQNASVMKMEIIKKLSPNATTGNIGSVNNQSQSLARNENDDDDDDDLVMPNTLPVQLLCPLSKCRIEVPVRGRNCRHVQCYDATTYLIINERKPTWNCPVCDGKAVYEDLIVDGLFLEILNSKRSQDLEEIIFHSDGSWSALGEEMASNQSENTNDNNTNNSNSRNPSEPSPCTDYNQLYSLQESPYASSHITSNSIRSATDSAGSSFVPSFNTLSPASSINSLSNPNNSYPNTLSMSPALAVRTAAITPLIRNDVDNISAPNTTKTTSTTSTTINTNYQVSVTVQSSRDKEQNQYISQEIPSFTIDLTLSDDENEQQGISARETASSIQVPTKNNNSSSRPINTVTSYSSSSSSSSSSLSPQFPPSDLSQSSHYSENNYQHPFSLNTSNKPSSTALSSTSNSKSSNQSSSIPLVYSSEPNSTQSVSVSQNLGVPSVSVTNVPSNQRRYPPVSSEQKLVQGPATSILCSATKSDVPVSLPSIVTSASCGGKRPSSSDYNFSSLNFHQSGTQSVSNNHGLRYSPTVHTTSVSNESGQYSFPIAKVPRIEIPHSQHYGSSSTQSQGSYSNNNNNNGYNNSRRCTNSPSGSNSYTYHSNITRQMPSDGYHSNRLTSSTFHSGQSSDHFYPNEHTTNTSSRYTYYNPNESGSNNSNTNRTYCYYPSSRHVSYPTSDSGTIYPYNRQSSSHIRSPYETHHRNVINNSLPRDTLHNSQMRSSDITNSTYCGNSVDSRRGFH